MELVQFEYGDCTCGHGYGCQASWKKEDGDILTIALKSPVNITPKARVPEF